MKIQPAGALASVTLLALMTPASARAGEVLIVSNQYDVAAAADFTANVAGHVYTPFNVENQVPTVAMMNMFDVVLLFEDGNFPNATSVGEAVADYYSQGGRCVVIGTFYWQERSDNPIVGSGVGWGALEGLDVFTGLAGGSEYAPDSLDPTSIVAHPITTGLTTLSADSYRGGIDPKPDTTVLATWLGDNILGQPDPLVGFRQDPNGGKFVGISVLPSYESVGDLGTDFTGDFHLLWKNTFDWCGSPCGNGVMSGGEQCDDGNNDDGDGCSGLCVVEFCGDGVDNNGATEECDDGDDDDTDTCVQGCQTAECGDGFVQDGVEACDDGDEMDDDECTSACALPSCGDGIKQVSEACDDGDDDDTDMCLSTCVVASCGDGFVHDGVETCDDANPENTDDCLDTCQPASCGDGFVQAGVEPCDDGNDDDTDSCVAGCAVASCGDGLVFAGIEDCDDANAVDDDECANDCTLPSSTTTMTGGASVPEDTGDESTSSGTTGPLDPTGDESTGTPTTGDTSGTGGSDSNSGASTDTGDTPTGGAPTSDASTGGDTSTGGGSDTAGVDDEGCGCATDPADGLPGGLLGPLSFGLLGRRRRARA
jgi:MYXO-CTERM domain-containing protein